MSFIECNCTQVGSLDGNCNDAGKCSCELRFDGDKCGTCAKGYSVFPKCESDINWNPILIPIIIIIVILVLLFVLSYKRYFFSVINLTF